MITIRIVVTNLLKWSKVTTPRLVKLQTFKITAFGAKSWQQVDSLTVQLLFMVVLLLH